MNVNISFDKGELIEASSFIQAWNKAQPAPPAVASPYIYQDNLASLPLGVLTSALSDTWIAANQPNAEANILAGGILEGRISKVHSVGNSAMRGFYGGLAWRKFVPQFKHVITQTWDTLIPQFIPVQQGDGLFSTIGPEGKMTAADGKTITGIWAVNAEVVDGNMVPWLQNQSNPQYVFKSDRRDPLPIGKWYTSTLTQYLTDDPKMGWQTLQYLDTIIVAQNVQTMGINGVLGAALAFYFGQNGSVLPDDSEYSVQWRNMRISQAA